LNPPGAKSLTVLVVAHDDAPTLEATVDRVFRALAITVEDFAVVIFDDGSSDGTAQAAEAAAKKHPFTRVRRNERHMGLGWCTLQAAAEAETRYIVYVPADNTWPFRSFVDLFGNLGKAEVVTSFANNLLVSMPLPKRIVSRAYSVILNLLFRQGIRYYNGLTIYPVEYLKRDSGMTHGFGFQAEALLKAIAAGYSFLEIALPVDVDNLPRARAITPANALNGGATILRLLAALYLGGGPERRAKPAAAAPATRGPLTIAITGASSGIGAALAQALAADGHRVFACARREERLKAMAQASPRISAHVCDVSDETQVVAFASAVAAGAGKVDVLINCAGGFGEIGPVAMTDSARWWRTMEVNFRGTYLMIRHFVPLLARGEQARILNFAGGGAFGPYPNYSAYACSKAAIVRLTECLAQELAADGIRVNAISPGLVPTEMHNATIEAGEERAGRLQFRRTRAIIEQAESSMDNLVRCVRTLISPATDGLSGKAISANFDPWQTQVFLDLLPEIAQSDLYTMRRVNVVNLPDGDLRRTLSQPWGDAPAKR
jgi:3-oxoacyl-[acyl-carrier protein] reductase